MFPMNIANKVSSKERATHQEKKRVAETKRRRHTVADR